MSKRIKPCLPTAEEMWECLERDGYVVIENVVSPEDCDRLHSLWWDFLEEVNPLISRVDSRTWSGEFIPQNTRGLFQNHNVGFAAHAILARMLMKPVFEVLYGTEELLTSFDGTSWTRKPYNHTYKNLKDWNEKKWEKNAVHIDQTTRGLSSIQGGLAVLDQEEDSHCFLCMPGGHLYHDEIMKTKKDKKKDWLVLNDEIKAFLREQGLDLKRIVQKNRGSVVLWDSRLPHASAPHCKTSNPNVCRLQIFACMRPVDPKTYEREMIMHQK